MACLVHNTRYRSLFHGVVNQLRNEKRIPMTVLRNMPSKCCTCNDIDKLTLVSVLIHSKNDLNKLGCLVDQINRDKTTNPELVLSLNRLENFIKENRGTVLETPTADTKMSETRRHSSSSEDDTEMDTRKRISKKQKKPVKPLKNGTFVFLPYKFEEKPKSGVLVEAAEKLQRGRFLGRNKYISSLEQQHNVCINMITAATSEQIKRTLNNAKAGLGKVKIHNKEDLTDGEKEDGEWILVRQKKGESEANTTDFEALLNELKNRWNSFLKVQKRKHAADKDEYPNKK